MSQDQASYETDQPAAIIDPPRNVKALRDKGLVEYKAWGWVKTSAQFRYHIKILRGAKHDIWHYLALGVDEYGKCKETIKDICEGTGYSHTEVINSLRELDELGYLSVQKDARGNTYTPEFVARGRDNNPTDKSVVKIVDSTPVYQVDSTPSLENADPSIKRVKRVNTTSQIKGIESAMFSGRPVTNDDLPIMEIALKEFESSLSLPANWQWYPAKSGDESAWRELRDFVLAKWQEDNQAFRKYAAWRATPYVKGALSNVAIGRKPTEFITSWSDYLASSSMYPPDRPKSFAL